MCFSVSEDSKGIKATNVSVINRDVSRGVSDVLNLLSQVLCSSGSGAACLQKGNFQDSNNQTLVGTVQTFSEDRGWGHIKCDSTQLCGKDVFLMKSALKSQNVTVGVHVVFKVTVTSKGPQANDVKVLPLGCITTESTSGRIFIGQIKSFSAEKGWGLLTSKEVQDVFGRDIFFHKNALGEYSPNRGDEMQFSVEICNGKLAAAKISLVGYQAMQPARGHKFQYTPY